MLGTSRPMLTDGLTHRCTPRRNPGESLVLVATCSLCLVLAGSTTAHADRIHLRTGETIKGKLIADRSTPDKLLLYRMSGKTPMTLTKAQVVQVDAEPSILDEYAEKRLTPVSTAQGEFELGEWCASKGLNDLATGHYEAAVKLDPAFTRAHEELGHVMHKGQWLTKEQARSASGLVYHKGKWITPEEADQKKQEETVTAEQTSWQRRLTILLRSYRAGPDNRRHDVETQVLAIRDNAAIHALLKSFGTATEPEVRILAARALGAIPTPEGASGLISRLLAETNQTVREATLQEVAKREEPIVVDRLTSALKSKTPEILNRAAWALGQLRAVETVPKLIAALTTTEQRMIWVDPNPAPETLPGTPMLGGNDGILLSGGRNIPILTGPAVGPGVVAYGATSTPAISFYSGMSAGLPGPNRGPIPKMQSFTRRNTEVLESLKSMTGQDFGYDVAAWRRWAARTYQPDPVPVRRVPEP